MLTWDVQDTAGTGLCTWPVIKHDGHTFVKLSKSGSIRTTKPLILLLAIGIEEAMARGSGGTQLQHVPLADPLL